MMFCTAGLLHVVSCVCLVLSLPNCLRFYRGKTLQRALRDQLA
jgi:hypothetical protein